MTNKSINQHPSVAVSHREGAGETTTKRNAHFLAGLLATLTIATFFLSTLLVELFGSHEAVATIKSLIVVPGLFVLVPAIMATGGSGFALAKSRQGRLVDTKKKRMPFIAANGLLVLVPSAIFLDHWASAGVSTQRSIWFKVSSCWPGP